MQTVLKPITFRINEAGERIVNTCAYAASLFPCEVEKFPESGNPSFLATPSSRAAALQPSNTLQK